MAKWFISCKCKITNSFFHNCLRLDSEIWDAGRKTWKLQSSIRSYHLIPQIKHKNSFWKSSPSALSLWRFKGINSWNFLGGKDYPWHYSTNIRSRRCYIGGCSFYYLIFRRSSVLQCMCAAVTWKFHRQTQWWSLL